MSQCFRPIYGFNSARSYIIPALPDNFHMLTFQSRIDVGLQVFDESFGEESL